MSKQKKIQSKKPGPGKKAGEKVRHKEIGKPRDPTVFFILFIIVITAIVYGTSLQNKWTNWDDEGYVLENPLVKAINPSSIFSEYVMGNYHPITVLIQAIEYHFFAENATGFHVVSLLLHLINALLVFYFVLKLTKQSLPAFICALLFAIHPIHVESVSWVSAQKDLLYTLFYFLALLFYLKYLDDEKSSVLTYCGIVLFFLLSLLSKAQAVTLPVVMLLIDYYLKRKFSVKIFLEKLPFFAIAIVFGVTAILAQQASKSIQDIKMYSWPDRLMFSAYAVVSYLVHLILPFNLSAYYSYPEKNGSFYPWLVYTAPVIVAIIAYLIYRLRKKYPELIFGGLFFFANIFLVLQLLPVGGAITADRYSYLSFVGLFFIIGMLAYRLWENRSPQAGLRIPSAVILGTWVLFLSYLCFQRTKVWKTSEALWTDVIAKYPRVPIAYNDLGSYYQKHDQIQQAKVNLDMALRLQPDFPQALVNRCDLFRLLNKIDSAIIDGNHAVQLWPDDVDCHMNRGIAFSIAEKNDSAMMDFNMVIRLQPTNARAYNNRGNLYMIKQMPDSAIVNYNLALKSNPQFLDVLNNRGIAYFNTGNYQQAISDLTTAIGLNPNNPNNYYFRMQAYEKTGAFDKALADANFAIRLGREIPPAYVQQLQQEAAAN